MISILLLLIAGTLNGAMDTIKFNRNNFVFQTEWWLENGSWAPALRSWLLKHVATMVSGGWHLLKFLMTCLMITAIFLYESLIVWYWDFLFLYAGFSTGFILGYYIIWRKQ